MEVPAHPDPGPVITSAMRVDPSDDVEAACIKIEGLRQAFRGGALIPRKDDQWIYGGPWLEEVRHGTITAPPGLLMVLDKLPDALRQGEPASDLIEALTWLAFFGADRSTGEFERVDTTASGFAYLAFLDILPVRHVQFLDIAARMWQDLDRVTIEEPVEWVEQVLAAAFQTPRRSHREGLILLLGRLSAQVCKINVPEAYGMLLSHLRHPWPEVRNKTAAHLRWWQGPDLFEELRSALLAGLNDPEAAANSQELIWRLAKFGPNDALPTLLSLQGTALGRRPLRYAIRSLVCPEEKSPRAIVRPTPIFAPNERVLMGSLPDGERVGVAVAPAVRRTVAGRGSLQFTFCQTSVRRSHHPAHIGHVNVSLSGWGESIENAERFGAQLAVGVWNVRLDEVEPGPEAPTGRPSPEVPKPIRVPHESAEPSLLIRRGAMSLWLVKQRDHRPYYQGLAVEMELREEENSAGLLRVYARWPDDPGRLLEVSLAAAQQLWREWLQPEPEAGERKL